MSHLFAEKVKRLLNRAVAHDELKPKLTMDDELGFLCYLGRETAHFSRRLHMLIIACFVAGLFMTWRDREASPLTGVVQASIALHEAFQCRLLFSRDAASQIRAHMVKAKMHAFLHLAIMAMMTISLGASGRLDAPWVATGFLSFLSLADRLPLDYLTKLQIVKVASFLGCVAFLNVDIKFKDTIAFIIFGGLVPYLLGAHAELRARQAYIEKHREASAIVVKKFVDDHPLLAWTSGHSPGD